ncbi:MAG: imelysin family protein [Candidatus Limisoma sp.]
MKISFLNLLTPALLGAAALVSSCSDDETTILEESTKESMLREAMTPYVDNTIVPTYRGMADNAILLADACHDIFDAFEAGSLTQSQVARAGEYWNLSRAYWEKSEAFLYGAADDYNIDPHIDSWPLDKNAMDDLLADLRNGKSWNIDNNAGYGLLGFHAVEYLLFELSADGNTSLTHNTNYTREELVYLYTVADDLRNQCVLLEASWAGIDNITAEKQQILEDADIAPSHDYGWSMKNAGQGGSLYKSYQAAAEDLIQGCIDIADEVGNTKIGRPANGSSTEDKNYIESPYSLNSINDFVDNIISIQNSYVGSKTGDASVSDYIKSVNPALDTEVRSQIQKAIAAIQAIPEPFAKTATGPEADNAVTVVGTDLVDTLEKVMTELSKNY